MIEEYQKEAWLRSWPELATRGELLLELSRNKKFRNFFFSRLGDLDTLVSCVKDRKTARHFLAILYKSFSEDLREQEYRLEQHAFNQSVAVLRNRLINLKRKLGLQHADRGVKNPHHVFI